MKKALRPEKVFDSLIEATLMCFGDKELAALERGDAQAILRASMTAEALLTVSYELQSLPKLDKKVRREIAEFKEAALAFLRSLHRRGILSNLAHHPESGVSTKFQQLVRLGDQVCAAVCPSRRMQYRLNFS